MTSPAISAVDQMSAALTMAHLRNQVIASNIANRDTVGYQRLKLAFDQALDHPPGAVPTDRAAVVPESSAHAPSLEEDMVALSSNALKYQALARTLSRYFSIAEVIGNGRS